MRRPTKREELLERFPDEELIFLDPPEMDSAIIGYCYTQDSFPHVVYDYDLLIDYHMDNSDMSYDEAVEFHDYNTERAIDYMGKNYPIIIRQEF